MGIFSHYKLVISMSRTTFMVLYRIKLSSDYRLIISMKVLDEWLIRDDTLTSRTFFPLKATLTFDFMKRCFILTDQTSFHTYRQFFLASNLSACAMMIFDILFEFHTEENAGTKHGDHHFSGNDLDDNKTNQTPADIKEVSNDPQSSKGNENRENRQDNAGSGDESSDSSSTDSSNDTSGSSSSTESEDRLAPEFPLRGRLKVNGAGNLYKNENGNYEWQWRNENGWDEVRKHESSNLQDVLRTWNNEKGIIIKIKKGYRWILIEEFIMDEDTTIHKSKNLDRVNDLVEKKTKIIFIGPVGSGKSATINTLLGEDKAPSETNLEASSLTKEITEYNSEYGMLVDTPGLTEEHFPSVSKYLDRNPPEVIVIVFAASRLRYNQKEAIRTINTRLGTYFDKSILLLTKGGDLQENEHDFIDKGNSKEILSLYCSVGKRCVVFENLASMEEKQKYICKFKDSLQEILNNKEESSTSVKENLFE